MIEHQKLIEELDVALSNQVIGNRADALRRVTDLFLATSSSCSELQMAVFDDVMLRLAASMESSVRAMLADRLAKIRNAPPNLIRSLADDEKSDVASPILRFSDQLDDGFLLAAAQSGTQERLLAISQRASINEPVTDALIARGDRNVTLSTVKNAGARISASGHQILVERSRTDVELAVGVWSRRDVPHHQLLQLFSAASDAVRQKLEAADRTKIHFVRDMMLGISNEVQQQIRANSNDYFEAEREVAYLHRIGALNETRLATFAAAHRFDATTIALSVLCDLPISACERALTQDRCETLLMLARAINLSWNTTKAILRLRAGDSGLSAYAIAEGQNTYSRLRPETARKALQFLRLRERAAIVNRGPSAFQ